MKNHQSWISRLEELYSHNDLVTRFAPSPTGYLHLGHIASAIITWGTAQRFSCKVLLRIEDHDLGRCRPEYEKAILEDLEWLGLYPDGISYQRNNNQRYEDHLQTLKNRSLIYNCECSRKVIKQTNLGPRKELLYSGTCRSKELPISNNGIRMKVNKKTIEFIDLRHGRVQQNPTNQCGDLLLKDRDNQWTYQFSATVDDLVDGINLIIRGDDLLDSTGRQIYLAKELGRKVQPIFLHHDLIVDDKGQKLSKRVHSTSIRQLKEEGLSPSEIIGLAVYKMGLTSTQAPWQIANLGDLLKR